MKMGKKQTTLDSIEAFDSKAQRRKSSLFKQRDGQVPLRVCRAFKSRISKERDGGEKDVATTCFVSGQEVVDEKGVKGLSHNSDTTQIFTLSQRRSWTSLDISHSLITSFLDINNVFAPFWRVLLTFGPKNEENEFEFPGYRSRKSRPSPSVPKQMVESAYLLRRVELNGREPEEDGHLAWSIRQTGVYHQYTPKPKVSFDDQEKAKSLFLLVAPSSNVSHEVGISLEGVLEDPSSISPWNVQRLLVADALRGWGDYMASLEKELKTQSDRIVCANVGSEKENLSPLTDIHISFIDRQDLKIVEDAVLDLQIILPTLFNTISRINDSLRKWYGPDWTDTEEGDNLEDVIDEFVEYAREAEMHVERAKALKDRADSTSKLLSDLLSYEEAVALKDLATESHQESQSMYHLTERSTKDAAAVKILTVITLIYLPTTIVANFFSTQFIQTEDDGSMRLSSKSWLLAAISIPLTVFTIVLWWIWVYFTKLPVLDAAHLLAPPNITRRQNSFKSFASKLSLKKRRKGRKVTDDEESKLGLGLEVGGKGVFTGQPMVMSPVQTFGSRGTFPTVQKGSEESEKVRWNSRDATWKE